VRLMLVTPFVPAEDARHGGGRLLFEMLEALGRRHEVGVVCFRHPDDPEDAVRRVRERCAFFRSLTHDIYHVSARTRLRHLFSPVPGWFLQTASPAMERCLRQAVDAFAPHRVQLEFLVMAPFAKGMGHPHTILNVHEAFGRAWVRRAGEAGRLRAPYLLLDFWKLARAERGLIGAFPAVLAFSPEDRDYLLSRDPRARVQVWRPGARARPGPLPPVEREGGGHRLLFVGSFRHAPNVDAVRFFCRRVLPRIHRRRPDAALDVVGPQPPACVRRLSGPRVRVHGYVPDLDACYRRAHVVVVPVRFGGGIRIKVLDALGRGVPVVSSVEGAEGLGEAAAAGCLFVEDGARAFADRVSDLLDRPELRRRTADRAAAWTAEGGSWDRAVLRLEEIYAREDPATKSTGAHAAGGRDGA